MDTLPLPPRPHLDFYRKRAKDLVAASKSRDPHAVHAWAHELLGAGAVGVADAPLDVLKFLPGNAERKYA